MPVEQTLNVMPRLMDAMDHAHHQGSFWRRALALRLQHLEAGQLTIRDAQGTQSYGTESELHAHMHIKDDVVFRRIVLGGTMAVAETYMEGLWDCDDLFSLFRIFAKFRGMVQRMDSVWAQWAMPMLKFGEWLSSNTLAGSKKNIAAHYDLGNDLFELFLDPTLTYSSAYYQNPDMSLEQASIAKLDRMCRMVELEASDHLLEIGSGWGSLAMHAAQHYGCRVTTITLSKEQKALAEQRIKAKGLDQKIEVRLIDYRELEGTFDKIISIEMIEAVGHRYLGKYFKTIDQLLKPEGLAAIQAITVPDQAHAEHLKQVDFIQKYIFPGSKIPSVGVILEAVRDNSALLMTDLKDIGLDYAKTMMTWRASFIAQREAVLKLGYDERFIRMWDYYLNYCAAGFNERYLGTVQLQFRKEA